MGAGLGLGILCYALWRLARALAIMTARLLLMALGATVWTVTAVLYGAAWLLDNAPRRAAPPIEDIAPSRLAELLAPYGRQEGRTS